MEVISHHFQNFSLNSNVDGRSKCREMVSCKIFLFGKMQRGRTRSFQLFQLDMYAYSVYIIIYLSKYSIKKI